MMCSRCNRSDLRGSSLTKVPATHACCASCPLRPPPCAVVSSSRSSLVGGGLPTSDRKFRISVIAAGVFAIQSAWFQFLRPVRFFHEAAFPRFSTNEALTGSVSFNYSVPLPLYMYNVLSTRSRSLAARPAVGLQHSPLSVCRTPPACSAAKIHARWRRRTVIVVSAAPSRLRRIPSTGTSSWARSEPFKSQCPWGLSSP